MTTFLNLADLYFMHSTEESYSHGKILGAVKKNIYLVAFDRMKSSEEIDRPYRMIHIEDMLNENSIGPEWMFFETREKLNEFLSWIETPSGEKILKFVKNKD